MKSFKLAIALTALATSYAANADAPVEFASSLQTASAKTTPLIIVSIDTKKIIDESLRGKEIQKRITEEQALVTTSFPAMEAAIKAKDAMLVQQQSIYNDKVKSLEAKSKMISEDARNKEIDELQEARRQIEETTAERERLIGKFNQEAKRAEQRLEALYKKEMMAFEAEIREVINAVSSAEDWDVVLTKESVIFASERTDKTSMIIKALDVNEAGRKQAKANEKAAQTVKIQSTASKIEKIEKK